MHDMFVRHDTVFASCGYDGLYILTYNAPANQFNMISNLTGYPKAGYNHSSTWSTDGKTLVMADEVPKHLPVKVLDVSNLNEPFITAYFNSCDSATPHNPYFLGDSKVCLIASYEEGTQIYDVSDKTNPVRLGYFDTHYQTTTAQNHGNYAGNWGCYDFGNGLIISNDMRNGLFVLDISKAISGIETLKKEVFTVWPNPVQDYVYLDATHARDVSGWKVENVCGQEIISGSLWPIDGVQLSSYAAGSYFLTLKMKTGTRNLRLVKN